MQNLDTAIVMADALAVDTQDRDDMMKAFTVIALHVNEHHDNPQLQTVEYWRRACDAMERCANNTMPSPACSSAHSAVDDFDY